MKFTKFMEWSASLVGGFCIGALAGAITWGVAGSCTVGMAIDQFTCTEQQAVTKEYPQVFECTQWSKK